jgi:hypothetical protein
MKPGVVPAGSPAPSEPWLWVVQTRGAGGWTTKIIPATERLYGLGSLDAATLDVSVTAVDRVGNAGPAGRISSVVVGAR